MDSKFLDSIQQNPVVAAVSDPAILDKAIKSPSEVIFILRGSLFNLTHMVSLIHQSGKLAFVHFDLIEGYSSNKVALKYLKETSNPDGIITTKTNLIKYARELNLSVIQRAFMLDSLSVETAVKTARLTKPDAIEILPGIIPRVVQDVYSKTGIPIIAGGLIQTKEDVITMLKAGAWGISTTRPQLWEI